MHEFMIWICVTVNSVAIVVGGLTLRRQNQALNRITDALVRVSMQKVASAAGAVFEPRPAVDRSGSDPEETDIPAGG